MSCIFVTFLYCAKTMPSNESSCAVLLSIKVCEVVVNLILYVLLISQHTNDWPFLAHIASILEWHDILTF